MEQIICVGIAILLFACFAIGYKEGLRLGMRSAKGIVPKPIKPPVKAVKDAVQERKAEAEQNKIADVFAAIESNDGYTEQERQWVKGGGKRG